MVEVEITQSAKEDIKNIIDYVYATSVKNAETLLREFLAAIKPLGKYPEKGQIVKEIGLKEFREIKLHYFRIIYHITQNKVQLLTVHHSARLLSNNLYIKDLL